MAEGRECWDCFYYDPMGSIRRCRRTGRSVEGDSTCSNFIPEDGAGVHACYECEYFGYYKSGTIFQKDNYCERKKKVVDKYGLACSSFSEG